MTFTRILSPACCAAVVMCGLSAAGYSQTRAKRFARSQKRPAANSRFQKVRPRRTAKRFSAAIKLGVLSGKSTRSNALQLLRSNAVTRSMRVQPTSPLQLSARNTFVKNRGQLDAKSCALNTRQDFIESKDFQIKTLGNSSGELYLVDLHVIVPHISNSDAHLTIQGAGNPKPEFTLTNGTHHVVFVVPSEQVGPYQMGADFNAVFSRKVRLKGVEITRLTP